MEEEPNNDQPEYLLDVSTPYTRDFVEILKGVTFREFCHLQFFANGVRLVVDDETELQINAYFKPNFFSEYKLRGDKKVDIYVKSKQLLHAMDMLPDFPPARLIYEEDGDPLKIHLETPSAVANIQIPTNPRVEILKITCDANAPPVKILFASSLLRDLVSELNSQHGLVKIEFHPDKLTLETRGIEGDSEFTELVACENNEEDFVVINSVDGGVIVCYQILSLRKLLPALRISKKVSLRVDSNGVLSVNIIAEHDQDQDLVTFVEFLLFRTIMDPTETFSHTENQDTVGYSS